ncbi:MAG: DUF481 domain-containing protein [Candidatus Sulfobium sp.]|jgi:putative salt-induced outer membrane protein YdiY
MLIRGTYRLLPLVAVLFFLLSAGRAGADRVILANGDSLSGKIERAVGGKLTLRTEYAGKVEIDVTKIRKISTSEPVDVHLADGEVLKGQLSTTEDNRIIAERRAGREATSFEWKQVTSINPPPPRWTGSITVAGNLQTGNVHTSGASVSLSASKKTATDKFTLLYQFNYSRENGVMTERDHYGLLKYDYFFSKKFYGYISTELFSDTFRDLSLRVAVGPGAGYQLLDDARKSLSVEAGVSYVNESRKEGEDKDYLTVRLGTDFQYKIAEFLAFSDRLILYPRLDYVGEYILRNDAALSAPVGSGWALKLENIIDRDSNPPSGVQKTDVQWLLGMQYSF